MLGIRQNKPIQPSTGAGIAGPIPTIQPGTGAGIAGGELAADDTTTTPKETFQNLLKQQPNLVGNVLQNALNAAFPFTKLTDNEKAVALQTANVVGGAVSSTIIPCLFDLTGPFKSVSDQNKFMRTALSAIRASVVTSHFPILLKQNLGGKNISGPDLQTLLDALVSAFLGVVGQLVQQSYGGIIDSSSASASNDSSCPELTILGWKFCSNNDEDVKW